MVFVVDSYVKGFLFIEFFFMFWTFALQDFMDYDVTVLIGAGIGVTPFASILKHIWLVNILNVTMVLWI